MPHWLPDNQVHHHHLDAENIRFVRTGKEYKAKFYGPGAGMSKQLPVSLVVKSAIFQAWTVIGSLRLFQGRVIWWFAVCTLPPFRWEKGERMRHGVDTRTVGQRRSDRPSPMKCTYDFWIWHSGYEMEV